MATETDTPDAEPKASSGGGLLKLIALALVCAGGSFGAVYFLSPSQAAPISCAEPSDGLTHSEPLAREDQVYVELEEILVTIGNAPATRYVKMQISVITDKTTAEKVKKAEPMLADAFVGYLRALQLTDFESADFYPQLREQLAHRSEVVLGGDVSEGVLITEFLLR